VAPFLEQCLVVDRDDQRFAYAGNGRRGDRIAGGETVKELDLTRQPQGSNSSWMA
jgi:hypothetical protein